MAKNDERRQRASRSSWLTTVGNSAGITWELVKKGFLLGLALFASPSASSA